jgi:hypothetical protein
VSRHRQREPRRARFENADCFASWPAWDGGLSASGIRWSSTLKSRGRDWQAVIQTQPRSQNHGDEILASRLHTPTRPLRATDKGHPGHLGLVPGRLDSPGMLILRAVMGRQTQQRPASRTPTLRQSTPRSKTSERVIVFATYGLGSRFQGRLVSFKPSSRSILTTPAPLGFARPSRSVQWRVWTRT